ncbi:MAG: ABC transporter substrate-binding protein [Solirubrobacteraceae bacterium]
MEIAKMKPVRLALILCVTLLLAGCGFGDGDSRGSANPGDVDIEEGEAGGTAAFLSTTDIDYADPGLTYFTFGFMVQFAVNRALYQYQPGSDVPVADLATGEPQIAEDNRTITVRLKPDIQYAPPVKGVVTSADVKYAIERAFTTNVQSSYAEAYFGALEGAPAKPVPIDDLEPFAGIETPNDFTLVLKLDKPVAQRVAAALVLPITVPVPREYAQRFDRREPSTYDSQVAFSGPYMIRNNRRTGELVGRVPGERIELVRNPNWDPETDFRPAYLNAITIEEGGEDLSRMVGQTLSGKGLLCCDDGLEIPEPILTRALDRFPTQVGSVPAGGTRWVALNTKIAPFDNLNVRKAVIAGFDRSSLRASRGGETAGPVAQGYLPPGISGHEESGGADGFEDFDWMQDPAGDAELARRYMLAAREDGVPVTPEGRYAGPGKILAVTSSAAPGLEVARAARAQLARMGFELELRQVPQETLFKRFCGTRRAAVAICPEAAWFKDFADPEEMLRPTFSGDALTPEGSYNWSALNVPEIDAAMREAALAGTDDRSQAWANVNRMVVEQAPGIPYLWDTAYQIASADLNAVMNPFSTTWDLNYVSIK